MGDESNNLQFDEYFSPDGDDLSDMHDESFDHSGNGRKDVEKSDEGEPSLRDIFKGIKDIKKDTMKIAAEQAGLQKQITELANKNNIIVKQLRQEKFELKKKLEFLEKEHEMMHREVKFQNLILSGLPDSPEENEEQLRNAVSKLIKNITQKDIPIDTVYRIGKYDPKPETHRHIRVRFFSHFQRNLVLSAKMKTPAKIYINEDLPFNVRQDHSALRKKIRELKEAKTEFSVDWKTRSITTADGGKFFAKDGKLINKNSAKNSQDFLSEEPNSKRTRTSREFPLGSDTATSSNQRQAGTSKDFRKLPKNRVPNRSSNQT